MPIGPDDAFVNGWVSGSEVVLLTRELSGRLKETRIPAEYVAYLRASELPEDLRYPLQRAAQSFRAEGEWLRLGFSNPDTRRAIFYQSETRNRLNGEVHANPFVARAVPHYEADLDPIRRLLTDTGAKVQRPRRAYLDLETDSRLPFLRKAEMRILCWAMTDDKLRTSCGVLDEDSDEAERYLLEELWEQLLPYDQVAAWNGGVPDPRGEGFDFPVLMARSERVRVRNVDARRLLYLDQMVTFRRMNMHAAESGQEKRSMALQAIAMATLGRGKKDFDARTTWQAWEAGGSRRRDLVRYCIEDTELLPGIEQKTGYLELFTTICEVCRLFPSTISLNPTRQMDGFLLRLAKERGLHFRSRSFGHDVDEREEDQFRGAFVLHPRTVPAQKKEKHWSREDAAAWRAGEGMRNGIARNVHVADFASLYPSIIVTFNMSTDTKRPIAVNGPVPPGHCRCPTTGTGFSTQEQGLLAIAVSELIRQRGQYNDLKASLPPGTPEWFDADRRSMAFKVCANSFYGVLGSIYSRYHDRAIAEGVTQNGVWLIQQTISAAEQRGWRVMYGDTDSIFVVGCNREEFADFVGWCNKELYPDILRKAGCVTNTIKLDYEKEFERVVFTNAKRYIGRYAFYKGKPARADSKPEVKGLEYKRGDASVLAASLQMEAVKLLMDGREDLEVFHELIAKARDHVMHGELPFDEIMLSKSLAKPLRDYVVKMKGNGEAAAPPPHVVVARQLLARGQDVSVGTRIEYVVVDAEDPDPTKRVIPAEDFRGDFDRHYVWESMLYPPTQRLLVAAFPDAEAHWDAWARSRPPRPRARTKVLEGQEALFGGVVLQASEALRSMPAPPLPRHYSSA
jgi:DNA polymerase elongation subunit (family B)